MSTRRRSCVPATKSRAPNTILIERASSTSSVSSSSIREHGCAASTISQARVARRCATPSKYLSYMHATACSPYSRERLPPLARCPPEDPRQPNLVDSSAPTLSTPSDTSQQAAVHVCSATSAPSPNTMHYAATLPERTSGVLRLAKINRDGARSLPARCLRMCSYKRTTILPNLRWLLPRQRATAQRLPTCDQSPPTRPTCPSTSSSWQARRTDRTTPTLSSSAPTRMSEQRLLQAATRAASATTIITALQSSSRRAIRPCAAPAPDTPSQRTPRRVNGRATPTTSAPPRAQERERHHAATSDPPADQTTADHVRASPAPPLLDRLPLQLQRPAPRSSISEPSNKNAAARGQQRLAAKREQPVCTLTAQLNELRQRHHRETQNSGRPRAPKRDPRAQPPAPRAAQLTPDSESPETHCSLASPRAWILRTCTSDSRTEASRDQQRAEAHRAQPQLHRHRAHPPRPAPDAGSPRDAPVVASPRTVSTRSHRDCRRARDPSAYAAHRAAPSPRAQKALEMRCASAERGSMSADAEHILLSLTRETEASRPDPARVGVDHQTIRDQLVRPPSPRPEDPPEPSTTA